MSPLVAAASYPPARRSPDGGDVAGTYVADPFRWLEDADAEETRSFVAAQNKLARSVLDGIDARTPIHASLSERWTYPRAGVPFSRGGRWFQLRNSGNENQPVLWTMDDPGAHGEVLLDPNALSADGTVAITALSVSPDGGLVAYSTSDAGSDCRPARSLDRVRRRPRRHAHVVEVLRGVVAPGLTRVLLRRPRASRAGR